MQKGSAKVVFPTLIKTHFLSGARPLESTLRSILDHPNLALPENAQPDVAGILKYLKIWEKWNQKVNLTSEKDPLAFFRKHFFDSLQFCRVVEEHHLTMDIGSGGGFPGLPLKLVYPQLNIVLVESQRKRANFLRQVVYELGLQGIDVLQERCQAIQSDPKYHSKFDRVVFRAVSRTAECLRLGGPFLSASGQIVLKRSADSAAQKTTKPGFELVKNVPVLGFNDKLSSLWVFTQCST